MSKELGQVMQQVDALTAEEQLELISYLVERLKNCEMKQKPRRHIMDLCGIAPNMLGGMDAQDYVNRIRRGEFPELEIKARQET